MTYIILRDPYDDEKLYDNRNHAIADCASLNRASLNRVAEEEGDPLVYAVYELRQVSAVPLCRCSHPRGSHDFDYLHRHKRCTVETEKDGRCRCVAFQEDNRG